MTAKHHIRLERLVECAFLVVLAYLAGMIVASVAFGQEPVGTILHGNGVADAIDGMGAKVPGWIALLTAIMVAAKVITTVTPTQADNLILAALLRFINIVALNVGKAKNADDMDPKGGP